MSIQIGAVCFMRQGCMKFLGRCHIHCITEVCSKSYRPSSTSFIFDLSEHQVLEEPNKLSKITALRWERLDSWGLPAFKAGFLPSTLLTTKATNENKQGTSSFSWTCSRKAINPYLSRWLRNINPLSPQFSLVNPCSMDHWEIAYRRSDGVLRRQSGLDRNLFRTL